MRKPDRALVTIAGVTWTLAVAVAAETLDLAPETQPWALGAAAIVTVLYLAAMWIGAEKPRLSGPPESVDEARESLARLIEATWTQTLERLQVRDRTAMWVRWHPAPAELVDPSVVLPEAHPQRMLVPFFSALPDGRLALIGRAGSGKTVLAARLALELLKRRTPDSMVPVVVTAGSWHPATQTFRAWLEVELGRLHPGLTTIAPGGRTLANLLLNTGRILPIVDGFEEVPEIHHSPAIAAMNDFDQPLIVVSRQRRYTAAVQLAGPLAGAAVIQLEDIDMTEARRYLGIANGLAPQHAKRWNEVLSRLEAGVPQADAALRAALGSPLMVHLAAANYAGPETSPSEILDRDRFPSRADLERHLLGGYIAAAFHDSRWSPQSARRWLHHHALRMDRAGTREIGWWQLHALPENARSIGFIIALFLLGGYLIGAVGGVAAWMLGRTSDGPQPAALTLRLNPRWTGGLRTLLLHVASGGVLGVLLLLCGASPAALFASLGVGVAYGLIAALQVPIQVDQVYGIRESVRLARSTALWWSLAGAAAYAVVAGQAGSLVYGPLMHPLANAAGPVVVGGLLGALFALMSTAWGKLIFTRFLLAARRRLPWRTAEFFAEAHRRGVLYERGATHQFRHALLQDHLVVDGRDRRADAGMSNAS